MQNKKDNNFNKWLDRFLYNLCVTGFIRNDENRFNKKNPRVKLKQILHKLKKSRQKS